MIRRLLSRLHRWYRVSNGLCPETLGPWACFRGYQHEGNHFARTGFGGSVVWHHDDRVFAAHPTETA